MSSANHQNKSARRPRKKRHGGVLTKLVTMLILIVAVFFGVTIFFKISQIDVSGNQAYTPDEIVSASGLENGQSMILLNKSVAASQILAKLPYVDQVRILRRLPGTVSIQITEGTASAAIQDSDGNFWLLSNSGKLLEQAETDKAAAYTQIIGATVSAPSVAAQLSTGDSQTDEVAVELLQSLQDAGILDQIKSIDLTKNYDIQMWYGDRFHVLLGTSEELDYKIRFLKTAIENLEDNQSGEIDLTFETAKYAYFRPW